MRFWCIPANFFLFLRGRGAGFVALGGASFFSERRPSGAKADGARR